MRMESAQLRLIKPISGMSLWKLIRKKFIRSVSRLLIGLREAGTVLRGYQMFEIEPHHPTTDAPYFAREVHVDLNDRIIVDGRQVSLWGVSLRKGPWADQLRLLLRWRRVYVIPRSHDISLPPSVTLFTGRGDLASYLIWNGSATAVSYMYWHVQLAAFCKQVWYFRRRNF